MLRAAARPASVLLRLGARTYRSEVLPVKMIWVGVDFDTALYFVSGKEACARKRPTTSFSRFILTGRISDRGYSRSSFEPPDLDRPGRLCFIRTDSDATCCIGYRGFPLLFITAGPIYESCARGPRGVKPESVCYGMLGRSVQPTPGRARDHPVMEIVPNKSLNLSLRQCITPRGARNTFMCVDPNVCRTRVTLFCHLGLKSGFESPDLLVDGPGRLPHHA